MIDDSQTAKILGNKIKLQECVATRQESWQKRERVSLMLYSLCAMCYISNCILHCVTLYSLCAMCYISNCMLHCIHSVLCVILVTVYYTVFTLCYVLY